MLTMGHERKKKKKSVDKRVKLRKPFGNSEKLMQIDTKKNSAMQSLLVLITLFSITCI